MGICMYNPCMRRDIFCNKPQGDIHVLIVDINEKKVEINEDNKHQNEKRISHNNRKNGKFLFNSKKDYTNQNKNMNKNEIAIFNIQARYKYKSFKNNLNSNTLKNSFKNKNDKFMNEVNKYKKNNEMFDKLIHFTNFNERKHINTSASTSNIK